MLSPREDATSGDYFVQIDEYLAAAIEQRPSAGSDGEEDDQPEPEPVPVGAPIVWPARPKPVSELSPREIQSRLRSGMTTADVADEAGVAEEWVLRFADPIRAEQSRVAEQAQTLTFHKPRVGPSSQPLRTSVRWNLMDQGAWRGEEAFNAGWSAFNLQGARWAVRFSFVAKRRRKLAEWEVDVREGALTARNRVATDLGYVEPGRRRRRPPEEVSAPPPARGRLPRRAGAKKAAAKKAAAKRTPVSKRAGGATTAAPRKAAAKKAPAKATSKKKAPAKATSKRTGPPKAATRAPTKSPPKRAAAPRATATRKATAKKAGKKGSGRKATSSSKGPSPVASPPPGQAGPPPTAGSNQMTAWPERTSHLARPPSPIDPSDHPRGGGTAPPRVVTSGPVPRRAMAPGPVPQPVISPAPEPVITPVPEPVITAAPEPVVTAAPVPEPVVTAAPEPEPAWAPGPPPAPEPDEWVKSGPERRPALVIMSTPDTGETEVVDTEAPARGRRLFSRHPRKGRKAASDEDRWG